MSDELYFDVEQVYEEYHAQPALSRSEEMFRAGMNYQDIAEQLEAENAKLREYAAKAWSLFVRYGAVHACDLSEVDAVRDGLRELGIEVEP